MKQLKIWSILSLLVCLLLSQQTVAQRNPVFKMTKENGHFYLTTQINGVEGKMMFETGVPGFMIGDAFYNAHKEALNMDVQACHERIRYLGGLHNVTFTGNAKLRIGDAIFEGPVKIIENDANLKLPIHLLHHPSDSSSIVMMDLKKSKFSMLTQSQLQEIVKDGQSFPLTFNKWHMPVVNTRLSMSVGGQQLSITGNFITDMGNASLLFLNKSQEDVIRLLTDNSVKLQEARNKSGKVVSEGLLAESLVICNRKYTKVSVGVNPFKSLSECGFLGLKFFSMPTIFDFSNSRMYLLSE